MPVYKFYVSESVFERAFNEIIEYLKKKCGKASINLPHPSFLVATKKELSEDDVEEIRQVVTNKLIELIKNVTHVHKY